MDNQNTLVDKLEKFASILEKPLEICVGIFLSMIAVSVFILVVARNINIPVVWLGEVSTFAAIWTTFFGFALAYRYNMFANVDLITKALSPTGKEILEMVWNAIGMLFMIFVAWSSKDFLLHVMKSGTRSPEMRVPLYIIYSGPVISYIITTYFGFVRLLKQISKLRQTNKVENI